MAQDEIYGFKLLESIFVIKLHFALYIIKNNTVFGIMEENY